MVDSLHARARRRRLDSFGVGWTVNLGRAYALVRSIAQKNAPRPTSSR
jgi:hypothetical protein